MNNLDGPVLRNASPTQSIDPPSPIRMNQQRAQDCENERPPPSAKDANSAVVYPMQPVTATAGDISKQKWQHFEVTRTPISSALPQTTQLTSDQSGRPESLVSEVSAPRKGNRPTLENNVIATKQSAKTLWKRSISVVQSVNRSEDVSVTHSQRRASRFWQDVLATTQSVDVSDGTHPETDEELKRALYLNNLKQRMSRVEVEDRKVEELKRRKAVVLQMENTVKESVRSAACEKVENQSVLEMAVEKGREEMVMIRRASQVSTMTGFQKILSPQIPIIVPTSKRKRRWDIMIMLLVIFTATILPYQAAFGGGETPSARTMNWTTDVFFVLDIVCNFRTAFIDGQGRLITKTSAISQRYLQSWFIIDFVSILPFELFGGGHSQLVQLLKCTRLLRLAKVAKFLDFVKFLEKSEYANMYRIFKLFATFLLMVHLTACFFWIIIDGQNTDDTGQMKWNTRFEGSSRFTQYSVSVYYSLLMLVGENIDPNTTIEMVVVSICMIVGAIFYANLFGQVSVLVTNFNRTSSRFKEKLDIVNENMRTLQLPDELRVRVNHYYEYKWNRNRCLDHTLFLKGLSKALASEVSLHCYRELIAECPMFKDAGGDASWRW